MGATGNVGSQVVASLRGRGTRVRAVSRRERSWPDGVDGFVGDPNVEHGLDEAVDGVDAVFMMSGYAAESGLLDAVGDAHVVLLSASSAPLGDQGNAMAAMHLDSERAVSASGVSWTFLRPCSLQSNLLRWRDQLAQGDDVQAPFGDVSPAMIDPADVGAVAALALTTPGHEGQIYRLSGPAALTPADQVALLGESLGRELVFRPMTDDEARAQIGSPYGDAAVEIFRGHPELETEVQPTVERLLGRPPGSLKDWLARNVDRWSTYGPGHDNG
jgi:uncharacterized protein YbjT (DUF2867 family)